MTHRALRVLVTSASAVQIAFGVWHFFANAPPSGKSATASAASVRYS